MPKFWVNQILLIADYDIDHFENKYSPTYLFHRYRGHYLLMDFSWTTEEQQQFDDTVEFARASLASNMVERDLECHFSRELWANCAQAGVLAWPTPRNLGGSGHSGLTCARLMEALGYGCNDNGLLFALGTQMWGMQSCLTQFGNDDQHQRYLPAALSGNVIGAYAINEKDSGSSAFSLNTTATREGDSYLLNGEKTLIAMAPVADFSIIFAVTNPDAGRWGLSAFIVDANTPGYTASSAKPMMGIRTAPIGNIELKECRVPSTALLGKEGMGASIFGHSQSWERSLILATQVGTMRRQLEYCVDHAKNTLRGAQAIGKNQAVSHRIANMKIKLDCSQLLLYRTAWLLSQGKQNLLEAAITKTYLSEAFTASSTDAISVLGGAGYTTEQGIERDMRDSVAGTIYGGTVDLQRNIIAGLLGL